jgi:2-polyprenyl-3-methyl-5-hydroxy-6-metoxy-1,4-benzoquinol methylase
MSVVMCKTCGLVATFPNLSRCEINEFYFSSFAGDPGAPKLSLAPVDQTMITTARLELDIHTIPIIEKWVDPQGKDWLEIRFRTGAFLQYLRDKGANPFGADLFDANLQQAAKIVTPDSLFKTSVHNLLEEFDTKLDVVSGVSIHVLSHLPNPSRAISTIRDLLKDDGLIIFEEKDITKIPLSAQTLPLSHPNPVAHYHHFTLKTCKALIAQGGFQILFAEYIERVSDLHHFLIIAKKSNQFQTLDPVSKDEIDAEFSEIVNLHKISDSLL